MTDLEEYLRWRGLDCHVVTNCEDYENCDLCLVEHIKKHDAKVRQDAIEEELQSFAQWLWDSHYLVDEAFTIRLVEQYKDEQLKEKK